MKILLWAKSPCIRTYKEAVALRTYGVETVLAYAGQTIGGRYPGLKDEDAFDEIAIQKDISRFHYIDDQKVDVIHTAHPPDSSVRELLGANVPIVHDFHDLESFSESPKPLLVRHEKDAACCASALVFVSGSMERSVKATYPGAAMMGAVIPNAAGEEELSNEVVWHWPAGETHVVYAAAMPHWGDGHFRDLKPHADQLIAQGIFVHVHALIIQPALQAAAAHCPLLRIEPQVTGLLLLEQLEKYHAGIIPHRGRNKLIQKHIDMSVPNKLYEYWQVGVPVICLPAVETQLMVEEYKLGWIVEDYSNLASVIKQPYKPKRKVIRMREEVRKLISLYEDVLWR